jgi:enamine deaminase RidA (YjgF/YER057c/UK114 family)
MTDRQTFSSGAPWEPIVGYSRAVRVGSHVWVSGTTATDANGKIVGKGDPRRQVVQVLENIATALARSGAALRHVVRSRIYITDMAHWEIVGRAHGEVFHAIRPASTLVQVSALVDPDILVEIEVDAFVND